MPRFRKPKFPATTPPSPGEVQNLTSKKKSKSLVATSAAIALSIGSPSPDSRGASSNDTTVRQRGMDWQAAYGAARMAVEIAKESSDMFLPLKAVVGAMFILIKNYDASVSFLRTEHLLILCLFPLQQTADNMDQVKEIEQRVQSLSSVLASPVGEDDHAEKGRRAELQRFVLAQMYSGLLILHPGSSMELSRSSNHFPKNMCFLGSYATSIMPKA